MFKVRNGKNIFQAQIDIGFSICRIWESAVVKAKIDSLSELEAFGGATIKWSGIIRERVIVEKLKPRKLI